MDNKEIESKYTYSYMYIPIFKIMIHNIIITNEIFLTIKMLLLTTVFNIIYIHIYIHTNLWVYQYIYKYTYIF